MAALKNFSTQARLSSSMNETTKRLGAESESETEREEEAGHGEAGGETRERGLTVVVDKTPVALKGAEDVGSFAGNVTEAGLGFEVIEDVKLKTLTLPIGGDGVLFHILGPIVDGEFDDPKMGKARTTTIESLDGERRTLVVGAVLESALTRKYGEGGFVGRWFHVIKFPPRPKKDYADYQIREVRLASR
jgi:hypothetical protein